MTSRYKESREQVTVICPSNDLEGKTLLALSRRLGLDTRESKQEWGAKLEREPETNLLNLRREVWIVELPGPEVEERLRSAGHRLCIIDHHWYWHHGAILDRRNDLSSLEQFAQRAGADLTAEEQAIAMNDRGYLWAMLEEGVPFQVADGIRAQERRARVASVHHSSWSLLEASRVCEVWAGTGSHAELLDGLQTMGERDWRIWTGRGWERAALEPQRWLLDLDLKSGLVGPLTGYGPLEMLEAVWQRLPACRERWLGGDARHGFAGGALEQPVPPDTISECIVRSHGKVG